MTRGKLLHKITRPAYPTMLLLLLCIETSLQSSYCHVICCFMCLPCHIHYVHSMCFVHLWLYWHGMWQYWQHSNIHHFSKWPKLVFLTSILHIDFSWLRIAYKCCQDHVGYNEARSPSQNHTASLGNCYFLKLSYCELHFWISGLYKTTCSSSNRHRAHV